MDNSTYYQKIDIILKRAKDYFHNNIETIRKDMRNKYKNLSEGESEKMKNYQKNSREKMKNNEKQYFRRKNGENERISKKL